MNKVAFIKELAKELKYPESKVKDINKVLEDNFLIGRKNKDKIVDTLINKLKINNEEANKIYNTAMNILSKEIKNKIINPFKTNS